MLRKHVQIDRRISILIVVGIITVVLLIRFLPQQLKLMSNQEVANKSGLSDEVLNSLYHYLGYEFRLLYAQHADYEALITSPDYNFQGIEDIWCVIIQYDNREFVNEGIDYLLVFQEAGRWERFLSLPYPLYPAPEWDIASCDYLDR